MPGGRPLGGGGGSNSQFCSTIRNMSVGRFQLALRALDLRAAPCPRRLLRPSGSEAGVTQLRWEGEGGGDFCPQNRGVNPTFSLSAAPVSDGTLRRIVLSRLASWALAYNNAPVAMVKTVLGRNAMRCGALSRPAHAAVARMLQRWYPAECLKLRRASQSPTALEQRIVGLYQGCRCCFQSSPLKRIVCHIT